MRLSVNRLFLKFSIFLLFISFFLLAKPSFAQAPSVPQAVNGNYAIPEINPDVPKNLHTYTQSVLMETLAAVACQLTGIDPTTADRRCLGNDPVTGKIGYVDGRGGAIGFTSNMIGMLYTPPASSVDYINHLAQNFGITKQAQAKWMDDAPPPGGGFQPDYTAGTGFQGIKPLLPLWEAFRNIVYLLFILVFVIIGVAIMLRLKIDPRTVMTIQNQIPKVIVGLLLVTLSFAIAGFLIDIMWVSIYLVYGIFAQIPGVDVTPLSPQHLVGTTPLGAAGGLKELGRIAYDGASAISPVIDGLFGNVFGGLFGGLLGKVFGVASNPGTAIGAAIGGGLGLLTGGIAVVPGVIAGGIAGNILGGALGIGGGNSIVGFLGGMIGFIIIAIALLWALIRIWIVLIMAYISILIDIVFAPFWIIGGLIPGSTLNFSAWVRDLVANLAAFPATIVILLLGKVFMETMGGSNSYQFVPPLIGNPGDIKAFQSIIGIGILLTIPSAVTMMKSALKAPKLDFSTVGRAVGVGTGFTSIPSKIGQFGYQMQYAKAVPVIGRFFGREKKGAPSGDGHG